MTGLFMTLLAQTIRTSVPFVAAALGGVLSEKSGVVNIALEGILLGSGLGAVVATVATGSGSAGVLAGAATGALLGALHATLVVRARVNAILSGIAINVLAAGGSRFVLRALYHSSSNSPRVAGFRPEAGGGLLLRTLLDPLLLLAIVAFGAVFFLLHRTAFGLRVRAAGEDPRAVEVAGLSTARLRTAAVIIGGALTGLGGVALAFDQHQFQSGMSGGRGFIALAAVVLSGWRPGRAVLACIAYAALDALQGTLQDHSRVPSELVQMAPFVVTLAALAVVGYENSRRGGRWGRPPAALGSEP